MYTNWYLFFIVKSPQMRMKMFNYLLVGTFAGYKMSEYWLISAPGEKTCQQTYDTMNNLTSKQHSLSNNYKFHIPDLKVFLIHYSNENKDTDAKSFNQFSSFRFNETNETLSIDCVGKGWHIGSIGRFVG